MSFIEKIQFLHQRKAILTCRWLNHLSTLSFASQHQPGRASPFLRPLPMVPHPAPGAHVGTGCPRTLLAPCPAPDGLTQGCVPRGLLQLPLSPDLLPAGFLGQASTFWGAASSGCDPTPGEVSWGEVGTLGQPLCLSPATWMTKLRLPAPCGWVSLCLPVPALSTPPLPSSRGSWPCSKAHAGGSGVAGGGKHGAIHNLCSAPQSSCLANVKHCLGLFWALYFCKGCFGVGEGHGELFPVASTLENKTPGRKVQGHSLVMRTKPRFRESLEALG